MRTLLQDGKTSPLLALAYVVTSLIATVALIISAVWWFTARDRINSGQFAISDSLSTSTATSSVPDTKRALHDVGIQLFQWPWTAIARECRTTLGPMGIRRVLTSPPHENLNIPTWTSSYAPVSYRLNSKLGTRTEFQNMVRECKSYGVDIIADAVMNHMSPVIPPYRGIDGTTFQRYDYPGNYSYSDFHHCTLTPDGVMHTYKDRGQVQECDALALPDLNTSSLQVQRNLHSYLLDLRSLGVAGFRIDAAKHIAASDIKGILEPLPADTFIVQEVIPGSGEPIRPEEYLGNGRVFDFSFAGVMADAITYGNLAQLFSAGPECGLIDRAHSIPIITNHDLERDVPNLLNYRNGWRFYFANLLMLATGQGAPFLYTGYAFTDREEPSPMTPKGYVKAPICATNPFRPQPGEFSCMQRLPAIQTMVQWRRRAMSGQFAASQNHTSDVPLLTPAAIVWQRSGVVALLRGGLLFAANATSHPVTIPLSAALTDMRTLRSLRGHSVDYQQGKLTVQPFDIVVSMQGR